MFDKERIEYNFAEEFTPYPGPREEKIGPNSGEKFRDEILQNFFNDEQPILMNIDDTKISFGPSFLSESFGLFAKNNKLTLSEFSNFVKIKTDTDKGKRFESKMLEYVEREIDNV